MAGFVPQGRALLRSGARAGDRIYVSGSPGDSAQGRKDGPACELRGRFEYPSPRVTLGQALRGVASACVDVSDGLGADLARLAAASHAKAVLEAGQLPVSAGLRRALGAEAWRGVLEGGEDYELLFTAAPARAPILAELALRLDLPLTCIGHMQTGAGVELTGAGDVMRVTHPGFDHFANR
jgi:thiamine-monophosphate kinase